MKKKQQNIQNLDRFRMKFWDGRFMYEVRNIDVKDDYALVGYLDDNNLPFEEVKLSDGILLQCTGLTDKNGKLIYEGDIIQGSFINDDGVEELENIKDCAQIQFRNAMFCRVMYAGTKTEYWETMFYEYSGNLLSHQGKLENESIIMYDGDMFYKKGEKWEPEFAVIGNIYQNPELLNTIK